MTTNYQQLLAEHRTRVAALAARDARFVVNQDWAPIIAGARPRLIAIADNPGAKEREFSEYLSGRGEAGKIARDFFDAELHRLREVRDPLAQLRPDEVRA